MEVSMNNTSDLSGPIAQLIKHQSNCSQSVPPKPQTAPPVLQKSSWTGFQGKTLWDWLHVLGVFLIPVVIAVGSIWFSVQQNETSQTIALDQQRATTLTTYMDDMTELLLYENLRTSKADANVRVIARTKTLVALWQLDGERKGTLLEFLSESGLITSSRAGPFEKSPEDVIVNLEGANLSGILLKEISWFGQSIGNRGTDLHGASLSYANLKNASLHSVYLHNANLLVADLRDADLSYADLTDAKLYYANLASAHLSNASLRGADLHGASLRNANLSNADLSNADLSAANLQGVNLEGAYLKETGVAPEELAKAYSLKDATLPDGSRYPSKSYPIPGHQEP
ncbi:MAG: pentapeptide repeat-containing protein [Chloroflexi bacterium]|nr:MAG: pentapeptide repeat-containing protein [Chloroflexota bacterium]